MKEALLNNDTDSIFSLAAKVPITDGFGNSLRTEILQNSGNFISKTAHGYFKQKWMNLINCEIFIFSQRDEKQSKEHHVLCPSSYVTLN